MTPSPPRLKAQENQTLEAGFRQVYTPAGAPPLPPAQPPARLADLKKGQRVTPRQIRVFRQPPPPPPTMCEADLIRALRMRGIGRPATYAAIIATLLAREYAGRVEGGKLRTTARGRAVCDFLVTHYPALTAYAFTAAMEARLDDLAQGRRGYVETVQALWDALPHPQPGKVSTPSVSD